MRIFFTLFCVLLALPSRADVPVSVTVTPGARQTFSGFGASLFPWTPSVIYNSQVSPAQTRLMARKLWHDARFRSVRLWIHPGAEPVDFYVDGFVKTGKLPAALAAGATDLLLAPEYLPDCLGDGTGFVRSDALAEYAAILADFIRDFKVKTGILINASGILNEPNDKKIKFRDAQWPVMVKEFRAALDRRGLQKVRIIAPESANCAPDAYQVVDALKSDEKAWNSLAGVATHSYNNAVTEDMARRVLDGKKAYWMTEAGGMMGRGEAAGNRLEAASIASRFLNDVNHGVTHWQFFISFEKTDPNDDTQRILKYDIAPFRLTTLQKYESLAQLSETFPVGAKFRHCVRGDGDDMAYTYGKKPGINVAAAKNPDGTWAFGLSNFTSDEFSDLKLPDWYHTQGGLSAQTFAVILDVPELRAVKTLRLFARHGGRTDTLTMRNGRVTLPPLGPFELLTLRSEKVKTP